MFNNNIGDLIARNWEKVSCW